MAQLQSPKKTPSKFVDAAFAVKHFHQFKTNNLLLGHDSSARLYIGFRGHWRGTPGDGLPKAVTLCGSCRTLLRCYGRSKADVEQSNNLTLLWASIFNVLKSSLCVTKWFSVSYGGEKGECTNSGKASPFQKCKGRCFVSNCFAFWRPQTIGMQRALIVWYCETTPLWTVSIITTLDWIVAMSF